MAPLATGSDHGGSLRIPACYCGVVGHRSTPGVVPFDERTTAQTFYSVQGPIARTVSDAALLLSVIAGRSRRDPMSYPLDATALATLDELDPATLTVGVSADLGGVPVSAGVRATFADRVARIGAAVGSCREVAVDLVAAGEIDWRLRSDVFVSQYHHERDRWDPGFNPNIVATYDSAIATPMADIAVARRRQMELYQEFQAVFDQVDVVLCPGVSVAPFPWSELHPASVDGTAVGSYMGWLTLTAAITVVGHPVTALPCGLDSAGLPFGLQVIGPAHDDRRLLSVARTLERVLAADPVTARPVPDLSALAAENRALRTEGRTVHGP
jgi:Asp-tRNA(Asn)/Glu-tRNA(Gln) amidotransferase A subunit family amidase